MMRSTHCARTSSSNGVIVLLALLGLALLALTACTDVPPIEAGSAPALSGNVANSGVIGRIAGKGVILDATGRATYNALVALYGAGIDVQPFTPPIKENDGVTVYTWNAEDERLMAFGSVGPPAWYGKPDLWALAAPLYLLDAQHTALLYRMAVAKENGKKGYGAK